MQLIIESAQSAPGLRRNHFLFTPSPIRETKCLGQSGIALCQKLPKRFPQVPLCDGGFLATNGAVLAEDL